VKIISKRARATEGPEAAIPGLEITEHTIIITDGSGIMTPEEIKRAEQIFRDIRKQLEDINISILR
jgi:pyruvate/oxaloacetate carboxyltransferase